MNDHNTGYPAYELGFQTETRRYESALFPLPLLAFAKGRDRLLSGLRVYSIMRRAQKTYDDAQALNALETLLSLPLPEWGINDFEEGKPTHRAVAEALVLFETTYVSLSPLFAIYKSCKRFLRKHRLTDGQPHVLVSFKLLSHHDNDDLSELDLRVLFAINSVIGLKQSPIRITAKHISMRSVGAKDAETLGRLGLVGPTPRQVRYSLDKLVRKGFFHRKVIRRRIMFVAKKRVVSKERFEEYVNKWEKRHLRPAKSSQTAV